MRAFNCQSAEQERKLTGYKFYDQSELKTIILYIISNYGKPVDNGPITDIFMTHEFVDYFTMQTYLDDLLSAGLLETYDEENLHKYILTDVGREAVSLYKDVIPITIRKNILKSIKEFRHNIESDKNVTAHYKAYNELEHIAELEISEGGSPLLSIKVNCGSKEIAVKVCQSFRKNPQKYYEEILNILTFD